MPLPGPPHRAGLNALVLLTALFSLLLPTPVLAADRGAWAPNTPYTAGDIVSHEGRGYDCRQSHLSLAGWEPPNTPGLWLERAGTPPPDTQPPSAPQSLTSTAKTHESVSLSWGAATDNVGVTGYEVFVNGGSSASASTAGATQVTVTGLVKNTTYTFTVKARDAAGNRSAASNTVSATTDGTPPAGNKVIVGYWHNFDNGSTNIRLRDISAKFNVIQVAFAEPVGGPGSGHMAFTPYNASVAEFQADIAQLQSQGRKVLISIGGANGTVHLDGASARQDFVTSMQTLIDTYGFDGLDLDLEGSSLALNGGDTDFRNPTTPRIVNIIQATRQLLNQNGPDFLLTMAPETAYVQGGMAAYGGPWGAYLPVIHALRDRLTYLHVQHYNTGTVMALDGRAYAQSTPDFHVAMAEMMLQGFPVGGNPQAMFPGLRPDQVLIGLPSSPQAAGGGYTTPANVHKALDYLLKGRAFGGTYVLRNPAGYPGFKGLMTWSINWDAFTNFEFSNSHRAYLDASP